MRPVATFSRDEDLSIRQLGGDHPRRPGGPWPSGSTARTCKEWWDPDEPSPSTEFVREKYGPLADPLTTRCVVELDGRPIGYVQFYRWASWPHDAAAMDIPFDGDT